MGKAGTARIIILAVILLFLAYFAAGSAYGIYNTGKMEQYLNSGEITIDGTDFTPIFDLAGYGVTSFIGFMTSVAYGIIISVLSLILIIPLRLIAIRKDLTISEHEKRATKWLFISILALSVMIVLVITQGGVIIPLLIYTLTWSLPAFLIYVLPVAKHKCL